MSNKYTHQDLCGANAYMPIEFVQIELKHSNIIFVIYLLIFMNLEKKLMINEQGIDLWLVSLKMIFLSVEKFI